MDAALRAEEDLVITFIDYSAAFDTVSLTLPPTTTRNDLWSWSYESRIDEVLAQDIEESMMVHEDLKVYGSRKVLWEPIYHLEHSIYSGYFRLVVLSH